MAEDNRKTPWRQNGSGFLRIAALVPHIRPANIQRNKEHILAMIREAENKETGLAVFPQLSLTGTTCGDLFYQNHFYQSQMEALEEVIKSTKNLRVTVLLGFYASLKDRLFNCLAVIQGGKLFKVLSVPPSPRLNRWFSNLSDSPVPFMTHDGEEINISCDSFSDGFIEIGFSNSCHLMLDLAPVPQLAETTDFQRTLAVSQSRKNSCGYLSITPGIGESTSQNVFGGRSIIGEKGEILAESSVFCRENHMILTELDINAVLYERSRDSAHKGDFYSNCFYEEKVQLSYVEAGPLVRRFSPTPFVPRDYATYCRQIFEIQSQGLARRLETTGSKKTVIGISGGLDSTLALLVCVRAHDILKKSAEDILSVTMPGFGTTDHTYENALTLMDRLGTRIREISISSSVLHHFEDIGHDGKKKDIAYENAQARERTQILMDLANMEGGIVVGTGDMSEAALGWCTYNGDHMSMYNVNGGIPKTLVKALVRWYGETSQDEILSQALLSVADTPVSPELLPPDESGQISQRTEDKVGPYELHDFFLYHTLNSGMSPERLLLIAQESFQGQYSREFIEKWQSVFYKRFFSQQFKRSCSPDSPQAVSLSLSPHGQWVMPSDISGDVWTK